MKGKIKMNLNEFEIGMNVYDENDNVYKVVDISKDRCDIQPIKLQIIKCGRKNPFWFDNNYVHEECVTKDWWVYSHHLKYLFELHFNKKYVEKRIDDIIERIDALESYNGGDNGYLAKIEVDKFKKEILEFLKLQNTK